MEARLAVPVLVVNPETGNDIKLRKGTKVSFDEYTHDGGWWATVETGKYKYQQHGFAIEELVML